MKKKIIIISSLSIIICFIIAGNIIMKPHMNYKKAMRLMSESKLDEAILVFSDLGDFRDSSSMILESKYLLGKQNLDNRLYLESIKIFSELGNYKDSQDLKKESQYTSGKKSLNHKDYTQAISLFKDLENYKDSAILLMDASYLQANEFYLEGNFDDARYLYNSIKDYKDSEGYLKSIDILKKYQGTWEDKNGYRQLIFNGWKLWTISFPNSHNTKVFEWDYKYANGEAKRMSSTYSITTNGDLIVKDTLETEIYTKISTSTAIPEEKPSPKIGMTEEEVKNSNWGLPSKVNKTTTTYGVSEQWVYPGYKYIYLEDGIVTAIQESD